MVTFIRGIGSLIKESVYRLKPIVNVLLSSVSLNVELYIVLCSTVVMNSCMYISIVHAKTYLIYKCSF